MGDLKLASEFPALGRADWMKRVEAVLKGASFEVLDKHFEGTTAVGVVM